MKKIIVFIGLLLCIIMLASCDVVNDLLPKQTDKNTNVEQHTEDENKEPEEFFDSEMKHQPTNADMLKINKGMPFDEVVGILGKPHNVADRVSASGYFKWITTEGDTYIILFMPQKDFEYSSNMTISEYYHHSEAFYAPRQVSDHTETTEQPTVSEKNINEREELFDSEMKHKPTNADMQKIHKGMSFDEAVEIIGKPHRYADGVSCSYYLQWNTVEGERYIIVFSPPEDFPFPHHMTETEYYHHTYVYKGPGLLSYKSETTETSLDSIYMPDELPSNVTENTETTEETYPHFE